LSNLTLIHDSLTDGQHGKMHGHVPTHIAIVMDGNGRWATQRGMPRIMGHQKGVDAVRRTVEACIDLGVGYLTLYAFSTENWRRPLDEVKGLMFLLKQTLKSEVKTFQENNVRLKVIGRRDRLASDLVASIEEVERQTADNTALTLQIAFDYGGRDEIVRAVKQIASCVKSGELSLDDIDESLFEQYLDTAGVPDPELFIRVSNVLRISNFLTWQTTYSELVFPETYWPDFTKEDLLNAIGRFQKCERRFGRAAS
jgi:undecaprenyl diphosphate synthase